MTSHTFCNGTAAPAAPLPPAKKKKRKQTIHNNSIKATETISNTPIFFFMFLKKNTGQDRTIGELREFVATRVTEPVLQSMIDAGKVQVYMKGNAEFVRAVNHTWDDVQGLTFEQTLGGESRGANALEHCSIDQLSDLFQNALDDHEQGMDILQPTDQRLQASNCRNLSL